MQAGKESTIQRDIRSVPARSRSAQPARRGRHVGAQPNPWRWLVLGALALVVGGGLVVALRGTGQPNGRLIAEHTTHDFGEAPIHGGLIVARFPLAVQGATLVTDLGTS